jgi:dTDP-4-amino-4,6-dideoxygalactose transaminase
MAIRYQLAAYSPVSARASLLAAAQALHLGEAPRPRVRALLQKEYDAKSVLLCGSGTQALTIAIREAGRGSDPNAPVALPAFSCFDVASAAVGAGVGVSFYDLDADTLGPDFASLERVLKEGARVVVAAPLYGMPVDWDQLRRLCDGYGAVLIEDAAQGHGAKWRGRPLGSLGEISVVTFGRGKGWTGGTGGAVLMRGPRSLTAAEGLEGGFSRESGDTLSLVAQWALARPAVYGIPASIPVLQLGQTVYREPVQERSMTRAAAAALLATHELSEREAETRRANAKRLLEGVCDCRNVRAISAGTGAAAGYLRFPLRLTKGIDSFASPRLALSHGIAASYPRLLSDLPAISRKIVGRERSWPGAEVLVRTLVTLPSHSRVGARELEEIGSMLREIGR